MSLPVFIVLDDVCDVYRKGEYPEFSFSGISITELEFVALEVLDILNINDKLREFYDDVIAITLELYLAARAVSKPELDVDEVVAFKKKAMELGFTVSPMAPKVSLFNCVCGAPHTQVHCTLDATLRGKVMRCHNCGLEGLPRHSLQQAEKVWNAMIVEKIINGRKGGN
jgi:transcription elongation factor Elf1